MFQKLLDFINYWYFRYLMVTELYIVEKWERITILTELYMVEKWERILIHIIFAVLFILFWYFNYSVLLSFTGNLLGVTPISEILQRPSTKNV